LQPDDNYFLQPKHVAVFQLTEDTLCSTDQSLVLF